ncbi:MAG: ATP-dependent helicase HrpB [Amphritea sp.]
MNSLPVFAILDQLKAALHNHDEVVLQAPPGAGKTTTVPIALLQEAWLGNQKILMLEPRRLAARAAAERMAFLLGEKVGETVGYRIRLDSKVGPKTRIEVITEGILTRMLQQDPSLEGIGLVIFDEFHERSLDADLGLALCLQGRDLFRDEAPLKLLLMSATLDGANIQTLLSDAPLIQSEGRMYPVGLKYLGEVKREERLENRVGQAVLQALEEEAGSLLVFLPGQREIRRVEQTLKQLLFDDKQSFNTTEVKQLDAEQIQITPLYGDLSLADQQRAILPSEAGWRKIVLATSIAETSLTIGGVRVVIDAGLSREARFDPATGMTRLTTRKLSRAASVQRMGRAGRVESGCCYRLWSESQQDQLAPFTDPEILNADLAPLALQLHRWGVDDPAELTWLNQPPVGAYGQALGLLEQLGALQKNASGGYQLTRAGELMADLPVHPRLAHLLVVGQKLGQGQLAAEISALLTERDPLGGDADLVRRIDWLRGKIKSSERDKGALYRIRQLCQQFARITAQRLQQVSEVSVALTESQAVSVLLAQAYPDRIASRRREDGYDFQLSNGRAARLREGDNLHKSSWLAVAQTGGRQGDATDMIYLACELDPELFTQALDELVVRHDIVAWDAKAGRLRCEKQSKIGVLVINREEMSEIPEQAKRDALIKMIRSRGLAMLPWNDAIQRWRGRVMFLRQADLDRLSLDQNKTQESRWPDLSDAALLDTLEEWLAPYLDQVSHLNHFARLDLSAILQGLLPWPLPKELDEQAPERLLLPTGNRVKIDYSESPPVLAVKMQEMFGCTETPRIANGVALKIHLLSPAMRPLQVTQDLASFWKNSYRDVQKDMKGRYPKHYWPDDPQAAAPMSGIKRKKHT